ncbi:hypothetical protein D3C85_1141690 [compost metagenome]
MQVGGHDHIQGGWLEHHAGGHGVYQLLVDFHVREVLRHFVENLVPQHHAMALGIGFGDHGQVLAWPGTRQLEGKAMDSLDTGTGKHRNLGSHLFRQAPMHPATVAGVLAFGVFADHHPIDLVAVVQWAFYTRQHASRTHVGVLVEALADRQAQPPEGDVVRHIQRPHGAKENGIECLEFFQATFGNVVAVFQEVVRVPVKVLEVQGKGTQAFGQCLEHFNTRVDHLHADTVTRNRCNFVSVHRQLHLLFSCAFEGRSAGVWLEYTK